MTNTSSSSILNKDNQTMVLKSQIVTISELNYISLHRISSYICKLRKLVESKYFTI